MSGEFDVDLTEGRNSYKEQKQKELRESIRDTGKKKESQKKHYNSKREKFNFPGPCFLFVKPWFS